MSTPFVDELPTLKIGDADDEIVAVLRELQRAVLLHPEAARGLFAALAREGRAFAQTADGARWKDRLLRSQLVERAFLVFQTVTLFMLDARDATSVGSALVDAIASAAGSPDRDVLLERLLRSVEGSEEPLR